MCVSGACTDGRAEDDIIDRLVVQPEGGDEAEGIVHALPCAFRGRSIEQIGFRNLAPPCDRARCAASATCCLQSELIRLAHRIVERRAVAKTQLALEFLRQDADLRALGRQGKTGPTICLSISVASWVTSAQDLSASRRSAAPTSTGHGPQCIRQHARSCREVGKREGRDPMPDSARLGIEIAGSRWTPVRKVAQQTTVQLGHFPILGKAGFRQC